MTVDTEIKLISTTGTGETDAFLQPITSETATPVLASAVPVPRSEFYGAGQLGFRPDYEFTINPAEYHGETIAEVTTETGTTERVRIYRTFLNSADELELYCSTGAGLVDPVPAPAPDQGQTPATTEPVETNERGDKDDIS